MSNLSPDANHRDDPPHGEPHGPSRRQGSPSTALLVELREHVPFSVSAVAVGLVVAGAICILGTTLEPKGTTVPQARTALSDNVANPHEPVGEGQPKPSGRDGEGPMFARLFFHLFHPVHMLFSAAATAAMFFRYEKKTWKAIIVGLIGAIGVCGMSDIAMPQASLALLGVHTPWHICVVEHPSLVLPFAIVGVLIGIATAGAASRTTIVSHSLHVGASTMASIFYMIGPLGVVAWIHDLGQVFAFVVLAVMVPCCLSDIVFPLLMARPSREQYLHEPHGH